MPLVPAAPMWDLHAFISLRTRYRTATGCRVVEQCLWVVLLLEAVVIEELSIPELACVNIVKLVSRYGGVPSQLVNSTRQSEKYLES